MSRAYSDIAFTPAVRELQTRQGSRSKYEAFDRATDRRDQLSEREAEFIRHSDHFFQATVGETGWPYVQHRGGPPGFLEVLDDRTIAYADFRGNVQYISVGNLTGDDRVSLILMDYANKRRLKILGRARVVEAADDPELIARVTVPGYKATVERAVVISVEAWDWNCPQHITQRFTVAEVETLVAPLQAEIERLRARLDEAR
jgi:predicted pyridoxine 5'-phosphate oxidase superfamily flavin-nucleotide-binding protein